MNPYVPDGLSTVIIQELVNASEYYQNPLQTLRTRTDRDLVYNLINVTRFFPFPAGFDDRYDNYILIVSTEQMDPKFYNIQTDDKNVLIAVFPITNIVETTLFNERIVYFFRDGDQRFPLKMSVTQIEQYQSQKIAISNLYSFPGFLWMVNGSMLFQFIYLIDNVDLIEVRLVFVAQRKPDRSAWVTDIMMFDICNGYLISYLKRTEKLLYIWGANYFRYLNNVFFIENHPKNRMFIGGLHDYLLHDTSLTTANSCSSKGDTVYQMIENKHGLLLYYPNKALEVFFCTRRSGRLLFYGFVGVDDEVNLAITCQLGQMQNQVETFVYIAFRAKYTYTLLPDDVFYQKGPLLIWLIDDMFYIYKPTFPEYIAEYTYTLQTVSDIV